MFIYVTFDSNGFVIDYKKVETDGCFFCYINRFPVEYNYRWGYTFVGKGFPYEKKSLKFYI